MRVEANISVNMGTKVEVKNINSFKAVQGAIEYELKRQEELLESGGAVVQETRGWDDAKSRTFSQRLKENAHDYRYFPEPDLPPLDLAHFDLKQLKLEIPELPLAKRQRFVKQYGLTPEMAELLVLDRRMGEFFEESVSELAADNNANLPEKTKLLVNYLTSDLAGLMIAKEAKFETMKIDPENFADLIEMISTGKINSRVAKDVLAKMFDTGMDPNAIVEEGGLTQVSDTDALRAVALKVIAENPKAIEDYKKGKEAAIMFLVGKSMAALKGRGNPEVLKKIIKENIL